MYFSNRHSKIRDSPKSTLMNLYLLERFQYRSSMPHFQHLLLNCIYSSMLKSRKILHRSSNLRNFHFISLKFIVAINKCGECNCVHNWTLDRGALVCKAQENLSSHTYS